MKEHEVFMKYLWISHAATSVPANHRTGALSSSTSCPKRTDGRSVAEAQAVPGGRVDVVMTSSPWHRAVAARSAKSRSAVLPVFYRFSWFARTQGSFLLKRGRVELVDGTGQRPRERGWFFGIQANDD